MHQSSVRLQQREWWMEMMHQSSVRLQQREWWMEMMHQSYVRLQQREWWMEMMHQASVRRQQWGTGDSHREEYYSDLDKTKAETSICEAFNTERVMNGDNAPTICEAWTQSDEYRWCTEHLWGFNREREWWKEMMHKASVRLWHRVVNGDDVPEYKMHCWDRMLEC